MPGAVTGRAHRPEPPTQAHARRSGGGAHRRPPSHLARTPPTTPTPQLHRAAASGAAASTGARLPSRPDTDSRARPDPTRPPVTHRLLRGALSGASVVMAGVAVAIAVTGAGLSRAVDAPLTGVEAPTEATPTAGPGRALPPGSSSFPSGFTPALPGGGRWPATGAAGPAGSSPGSAGRGASAAGAPTPGTSRSSGSTAGSSGAGAANRSGSGSPAGSGSASTGSGSGSTGTGSGSTGSGSGNGGGSGSSDPGRPAGGVTLPCVGPICVGVRLG